MDVFSVSLDENPTLHYQEWRKELRDYATVLFGARSEGGLATMGYVDTDREWEAYNTVTTQVTDADGIVRTTTTVTPRPVLAMPTLADNATQEANRAYEVRQKKYEAYHEAKTTLKKIIKTSIGKTIADEYISPRYNTMQPWEMIDYIAEKYGVTAPTDMDELEKMIMTPCPSVEKFKHHSSELTRLFAHLVSIGQPNAENTKIKILRTTTSHLGPVQKAMDEYDKDYRVLATRTYEQCIKEVIISLPNIIKSSRLTMVSQPQHNLCRINLQKHW